MTKTQLSAKTKTELVALAKRLGLRGISTLIKPALVDKIADAQLERKTATPRRPRGVATTATKKSGKVTKRRAVRKTTVTAKKPVVKRTRTRTRQPKAVTPASPAATAAHKFDVTASSKPTRQPSLAATAPAQELPESYGTGRMFLTARDPHWVYAYWDLTADQLAQYRKQAADHRLVLRVFEKNRKQPVQEIPIQPDSRNWYVYVNKASTTYRAELGYRPRRGGFKVVSESREATTPADVLAADQSGPVVTIPLDIPFGDIRGMVRDHLRADEPLGAGLQRLQAAGYRLAGQPAREAGPAADLQEKALTHLVWDRLMQRAQSGSVEISEWLRRQLSEELSSGVFSGGASSPTSGRWSTKSNPPRSRSRSTSR